MLTLIGPLGSLLRVHHLNCGDVTMPGLTAVTHVLACEYQHGIVMVDVGIGRGDARHPFRRIGLSGRLMYPHLQQQRPAVQQLNDLGLDPADTVAIVATHLDFDHMGGVGDFPLSTPVLVAADEQAAAYARSTVRERMRYRPAHLAELAYRARSVEVADATTLPVGLAGTPLDDQETLWLLPLHGHTRGHCAVGIRTSQGWLIHAGDAFFSRASVDRGAHRGVQHRIASGLEQVMAMNRRVLADNHRTLRLAAADAVVICSHDKRQFREMTQARL